jgi:hypothetical protein
MEALLIGIAQASTPNIHVLPNSAIGSKAGHRQDIIQRS